MRGPKVENPLLWKTVEVVVLVLVFVLTLAFSPVSGMARDSPHPRWASLRSTWTPSPEGAGHGAGRAPA